MRLALTATPYPLGHVPFVAQGDLAGAFRLAAELGYDGVELFLRHPGDLDRAEGARLRREYGLSISALGTGLATREDGLTFADPDPHRRARAVERAERFVELAAEMGAAVTIARLMGTLGSELAARQARRAAALECLERVCRVAVQVGVTVLLEPLNRYESDYVNTLGHAAAIIGELGSANLRVLADTFHMNIEEVDPCESLRRAAAVLGYVHVPDSNKRAPGHGHVDFRNILGTLQGVGYDGFLGLEVLPLPTPCQAAEDSVGHVRAVLAGLAATA